MYQLFILESMFQRWNESRLVIIREKKGEELIDLFDRKEIYRDV